MQKLLFVGLGGFLGSCLRYGLGTWVHRLKGATPFPWETLVINVVGCLVVGMLVALSESRGWFSGTTRAFLFVGVLGGFTTFSAFGYETFDLMRGGQVGAALLSMSGQIVLGVGGVWVGYALAMLMGGR